VRCSRSLRAGKSAHLAVMTVAAIAVVADASATVIAVEIVAVTVVAVVADASAIATVVMIVAHVTTVQEMIAAHVMIVVATVVVRAVAAIVMTAVHVRIVVHAMIVREMIAVATALSAQSVRTVIVSQQRTSKFENCKVLKQKRPVVMTGLFLIVARSRMILQ
jgi:hypothetical protein